MMRAGVSQVFSDTALQHRELRDYAVRIKYSLPALLHELIYLFQQTTVALLEVLGTDISAMQGVSCPSSPRC